MEYRILNEEEEKDYQHYIKHKSLIVEQKKAYDQMIDQLSTSNAIVVFDYTTLHETTLFKLKVLNICLMIRRRQMIKRYYFDYMAKANYKFMIKSWRDFIKKIKHRFPHIRKIETWSDGGLKTKEIIGHLLLLGLKNSMIINVNYFAPYHGHNICNEYILAYQKNNAL